MPSRNVIKLYVREGIYHVYNRGVEKRNIFLDDDDYDAFKRFLHVYLRPPEELPGSHLSRSLQRSIAGLDLSHRVELLAWCLMPNHIHLVLRQQDETAMTEFMRRVGNAYVSYFNRRYHRVGSLFQGRYKAVLVDEPRFLPVTRYVHRNPSELLTALGLRNMADYPHSSYRDYLRMQKTVWLSLTEFDKYYPKDVAPGPSEMTYRQFVEYDLPHHVNTIPDLTID